jgi:hypothetical protein
MLRRTSAAIELLFLPYHSALVAGLQGRDENGAIKDHHIGCPFESRARNLEQTT